MLAAAVVYARGFKAAGGGPVVAGVAALGLVALLAWQARLLRWRGGELWLALLLDLPRRRRAIAGPGAGTWATDVVADRGRHAVLLLHFADPGDPSPPRAHGVPGAPWGPEARVADGRTRTIVAFEWADDDAAAEAAAARMSPRA